MEGFMKNCFVLLDDVCPLLVVLDIDDSGLELAG